MPTIKDVAKRAGVGVGTVSRVIAGKGPVAEATAERVRQAIAELEFRPSHAARSLLTGRSQTIGVFLPLIQGSFYTPILHAIYASLRAGDRHMVVVFGQTMENERREALDGADFLIDHGCDGILMVGTALTSADVETILHQQPKLVLINRNFPHYKDRCFVPNHKTAGTMAAETLLQAGHRRIAILEGPENALDNTVRIRGFTTALQKSGIEPVARVRGDFSPASGWKGTEALLAGSTRFTALFCANDEMAMGALSYLQKAGVSVPNDLSVMGYDGIDVASFTAPPLTTIQIPWRELAVAALNALLNDSYGLRLPVDRDLMPRILWRDSVARIGHSH